VELQFSDGDVTFGMRAGSRKLAGVQRDPRIAVHCPALQPPEGGPSGWAGDAKLAGTAIAAGPVQGPAEGRAFRMDFTEAVLTYTWGRQPVTG
jgi:hypothetical protein